MKDVNEILNKTLVKLFNNILFTEEKHLKNILDNNLSLKEIHVIEAVFECVNVNLNNVNGVSKYLSITPGTLTTSINRLVEKGYVARVRDLVDKRVVWLTLTENGEKINLIHKQYHNQMVEKIMTKLNKKELNSLSLALERIAEYFEY